MRERPGFAVELRRVAHETLELLPALRPLVDELVVHRPRVRRGGPILGGLFVAKRATVGSLVRFRPNRNRAEDECDSGNYISNGEHWENLPFPATPDDQPFFQ